MAETNDITATTETPARAGLRAAQAALAPLAAARRGSGSYGSLTSEERAALGAEHHARYNAAQQAVRYFSEAAQTQDLHRLPDERVAGWVETGHKWLKRATGKTLGKREPKRFPGLRWEACS